MKKLYFLFLLTTFFSYAQPQVITYSVAPTAFEENQSLTVTFNGSSINETTWGVTGNALYLWAWSFDNNDVNILDCPTNGTWTNSSETNRLVYNSSNDTYSITFTPQTFYSRTGIGRIGFLVKAKNATGDKKSQDILLEVGLFQSTLATPSVNSSTIINPGGSINITANNTNGTANYNLKANNISIDSQNGVSSYVFSHTSITSNQAYALEITQGTITQTKKFNVIVNPNTVIQALPSGMQDGINYDSSDLSRVTLVLDAPGKDFVYVAGSFNNYQPGNTYAMKKDTSSTKFWIEITGLTSGQIYTYQYWVVDTTPFTNSPALVKTADPYSTLVLSPFDDPWIPSESYPNIPVYPSGQEREVTVLQTGQTPYNWSSATTNFVKPKKEDLIVYEVLIRDFDANRNFQDLINKIDYFKNLNINAIELMPVMEFEGNEGWGYNPAYHLALDKFYGTANKFKEFIDLCHQNGIAVILDVALNHSFGRNPMVRMWMKDPDGDGWGDPTAENPYYNEFAKHSYGVGADFNHSSQLTKTYTKRVVKQWIQEYKIDGFRWDLTKGFTQACSSGDDTCTNNYQQDRVDILKDYADYSWSLDPNHYVIFEHLGAANEEQQWANHRIGETPSKGVMMWGESTGPYSQLIGGYSTNADISGIGHLSRGFAAKRLIGYPESHDKERLVFSAFTYGNGSGATPPLNNLNNSITRMSAIGATSILVPGPKMIWHFAELAHNGSIFTCTNGTVNTDFDVTAGDCKLDTKPQEQWTNNWLSVANRLQVYNDWKRLIQLKIDEPVFEGDYSISPDGNNIRQRIYIYNNSLPATQLKNVVVLANFSVAVQNVNPSFPYTGTWYDLMDNTVYNVTNTTATISIPSGGFRVFGNMPSTLAVNEIEELKYVKLYPNPANNYFTINKEVKKAEIYSITGQIIKSFDAIDSVDYQFDIEDLQSGIYLVKFFDANNNTQTIKLLKNN